MRQKKAQEVSPGGEGKLAGAIDPALYLELAASMLASGLSPIQLLPLLAELDGGCHRDYLLAVEGRLKAGVSWQEAWGRAPADLQDLASALDLCLASGAPSAQILQVLAARRRRYQQRLYEKSAARLAVKLVLPLGVCSLPAFICLGVLPVLLGLWPSLF